MRSSEEMALEMYLADWGDLQHDIHPVTSLRVSQPLAWDELSCEEQSTYLRHVNALMRYLFEHGRISAYISYDMLERLKEEYRLYLLTKTEAKK